MKNGSYRVWFTFRNELGGHVRNFLDSNGKGFLPSEALYVAGELKAQGKTKVNIVRINSKADIEEMARCTR